MINSSQIGSLPGQFPDGLTAVTQGRSQTLGFDRVSEARAIGGIDDKVFGCERLDATVSHRQKSMVLILPIGII